jgi:carbamoyltransferase
VSQDRILFVPQHLSHAAASYYPSPFSSAAYLTLDAVGEWSTGSWGVAKGHTMYPKKEMRFPNSVGLLYSAFTAYLGFEVNDGEFKVMGMAAYGKPSHTKRIERLYKQYADGSLVLDEAYIAFHQRSTRMYTHKFEQLFADCSKFDLAASIQKVAEDIILTMLQAIQKETGEKNIVFGGGVALNSVVNGLITKKTGFRNLFIFPAAGDDGASAGAALYAYHHVLGHTKRSILSDVFFGYKPKVKDIVQTLKHVRIKVRMDKSALVRHIARELSKGKIVGWYEGRAEFGTRALGHRSIIADPRTAGMKDIVNASIKFREEFRPFAPVVLSRFAREFFGKSDPHISPFMLATYKATVKAKKLVPAVVHDDGTARIQIVDKKTYTGTYATLLEAFYKKTGVPVLLNTSFNLKGEPIVNTPQDAIHTFMRSGLHILVLENFVITKYT